MALKSSAEIVRATGIGSSAIAGIAGISPWETPWTIYMRMLNLIPAKEQTEPMFWGTQLEPIIAQVAAIRMAKPIEWFNERVWSDIRPWQCASPDAFILTPDSEREAILECKTAGLHLAGDWDREATDEDGVPEYYVAQVQWQMSTTGLYRAYIAVLIAGQDFRIYEIHHDMVLEEILLEEAEDFWRKYILQKKEPPIPGSDRAREYLRRKFPRDRGVIRMPTNKELEILHQYSELRDLLARGEDKRQELENQLLQSIGEDSGLEWKGGRFTWKLTKDRTLTDWKKLSHDQMGDLTETERTDLVARYTSTEPGSRRIYFRETA